MNCGQCGAPVTASDAAAQAIDAARAIGGRLRCQPLLDRADALKHADVTQIRT